jgi:hypothetical protein
MMLLLAFAAVAEEPDLAPVASLKVDLDKVVELGTVSPVDGITSAGQPDKAALEVFADVGYATVIDMRAEDEDRGFEEPEFVEELDSRLQARAIFHSIAPASSTNCCSSIRDRSSYTAPAATGSVRCSH